MKRFWFGWILLIAVLLLCCFVSRRMGDITSEMAELAALAEQRALEEDWGNALSLLERAENTWKRNWAFSASVADHNPMEQIDSLFSRLRSFGKSRETAEFAAGCAELTRLLQAMGDAHALSLENLL